MNKVLGIVLAILVGVAAGMCFLLSINSVMRESILPLGKELKTISIDISELKANSAGGGNAPVLERLAAIEKRLIDIESKITAAPAAAAQPSRPMPPAEDYNKAYDIQVEKSPIKGKKDAPVTIVAFTDFQCPFCSRFHTPFQEAMKAYPNKVNFIIKNFPLPFHPEARPAAKVALAAGEQGKYHEMADAILENQQKMNTEGYKELAKKVGVNYNKLVKDLAEKDAEYEAIINHDLELVNQFDVRGTPTFFINGKKTMARDVDAIKADIEKALAAKGAK